jgi:hypothetical protein
VSVNEPRSYNEALGVDLLTARPIDRSDGHNAVADYGKVAVDARRARAVDDESVTHNEIKLHDGSPLDRP